MTPTSPRACIVLVAALGAIWAAVGHGQSVDLDGVWRLNYELSDDPYARAPQAVGARRPGPGCCDGRGRFGGGGLGAPSGRGSGLGRGRGWDAPEPSPEAVDQLRRAMSDQLTAPRRMTIEHDANRGEFRLSYDDGRYVRLVPDDREHAGISGSSQVTRRTRWEDEALTAEVRLANGQSVFHRFELRFGGEQLVLTTVLERRGHQDEVRLRRIYDVAPAH